MYPKSDLIFVYGTLLSGTGSQMHRWLAAQADLIDTGFFQGRLYRVGTYPGARSSRRALDSVKGEIYRLRQPRATLAKLDEYENYDPAQPAQSEYLWVLRTIRCRCGGSLACWIYLFQPGEGRYPRIPSGDFLQIPKLESGIRAMEGSTRAHWSRVT